MEPGDGPGEAAQSPVRAVTVRVPVHAMNQGFAGRAGSAPWPGLIGLCLLGLLAVCTTPVPAGQITDDAVHRDQLERIAPPVSAPDLQLSDTDGKSYLLNDYRGAIVVVNFWSVWCAPCRREMPALENVWQRLKSRGVVVLAVAIRDEPETVARFARNQGLTFPVLLDPEGETPKRWSFSGIPAGFVLDRQGRIVYRAMGLQAWDSPEMIDRLTQLSQAE